MKIIIFLSILLLQSLFANDEVLQRDEISETVYDKSTNLVWQDNKSEEIVLDWNDAVDYCNELSLAEYEDWRLPSIEELETIVDHKYHYIKKGLLNYQRREGYWSNTRVVQTESLYAWSLLDGFRSSPKYKKESRHHVRCVRGTKLEDKENSDYVWEKNYIQAGRTFKEAQKYCSELNNGEKWSLPTINQLISIRDLNKYNPAVKSGFEYLGSEQKSKYWSQTISGKYGALIIDYKDGSTSGRKRTGELKALVYCIQRINND